jgi:hypothetical protein
MKKFLAVIILSFFLSPFIVGIWSPNEADAFLIRLAAHFRRFAGEDATGLVSGGLGGGLLIYNTTVFAPASGVLYVTMWTNGDAHGAAAHDFTCIINGAFCNAGGGPAGGAPAGWIRMQRTPAGTGATNCNNGGGGDGDCHDNSITYSWCKRVPLGLQAVSLRMGVNAPAAVGKAVFIEKSHFNVDFSSSFLGSPATCSGGAPAGASGGAAN